ncbi:hypothetical protein A4A49_58506, partial [Nicotiana attenuata]
LNRANNEVNIVDHTRIDKGPSKPSRDVPAKTALARISNVVNPIVEAYDKLDSAAKILSTGTGDTVSNAAARLSTGGISKSAADGVEKIENKKIDPTSNEVPQKLQQHATTALKTTGDRTVAPGVPVVKSAVAGAQFGIVANVDSVVQAASLDVAGDIELNATDMLEAGSQHGQKSLAKGWSVVHRSPSKKAPSDYKKLEAATEFKCSNSFDALVGAHEHGEKDLQHKEVSANSKIM